MPIPIPSGPEPEIFPHLSKSQIDAARLSAWYPTFEDLTIESIVIDLEQVGEKDQFISWLDSDSIFIPVEFEPQEGAQVEGHHDEEDGEGSRAPRYHLPRLTSRIREAINELGGTVFPKLNWTAPRDAAFLLPQTSGPLSCTSPSDIYLLLKSSDFISHSIDPERAYAGGSEGPGIGGSQGAEGSGNEMKLELILRKYETINPSGEFRCFVRDDILLGASVRDFNYYPHFQDPSVREKISDCIRSFYEDEVMGDYQGGRDYIFDIVLNDTNTSCRLIDFNPYYPSSDPLLFTYEELHRILLQARLPPPSTDAPTTSVSPSLPLGRLPLIRVIDSQSHPEANRGMPAFGTNMLPVEMIEMSQGRGVGEFKAAWDEVVRDGLAVQAAGGEDSSDED